MADKSHQRGGRPPRDRRCSAFPAACANSKLQGHRPTTTARRRTTLFESKTSTLLTATALVLGVLGAAPLAQAAAPQKHPDGVGIPGKHPDIIAIPRKHPDGVGVPGKHPDIIAIPRKHPDIIGVLGRKSGSVTGRKAGGDPEYLLVRKAGGHQEDLTVRKAGGNQE